MTSCVYVCVDVNSRWTFISIVSLRMRKPQAAARAFLSLSAHLYFSRQCCSSSSSLLSYVSLLHLTNTHLISIDEKRAEQSLKFHSRSFLLFCAVQEKNERESEREEEFRFFSAHTHIPEISLSVSALRSIVIVHWCKNETKQSNRTGKEISFDGSSDHRHEKVLSTFLFLPPCVCVYLAERNRSKAIELEQIVPLVEKTLFFFFVSDWAVY